MTTLEARAYRAKWQSMKDYHPLNDVAIFVTQRSWESFVADWAGMPRRERDGLTPPLNLTEYGEAPTMLLFGLPVYLRAVTKHAVADVRCVHTELSTLDNPAPCSHGGGRLEIYACHRGIRVQDLRHMQPSGRLPEIPLKPDPTVPVDAIRYRCAWEAA